MYVKIYKLAKNFEFAPRKKKLPFWKMNPIKSFGKREREWGKSERGKKKKEKK